MAQNTMGNFMTILGFLNGMIGGTILLLPLLGIKSGYINSPLICITIGTMQFYTCYLFIKHIGKSSSLKKTILSHFQNNYTYVKIVSFFFWAFFVPLFFIYFKLIVLQITGLLGQSQYTAPIIAVILFFLIIIVRVKQIGEETLAYGITCIITYVLFLIWSFITAPEGDQKVPPFGESKPMMATIMLSFDAISIISQNIFKNTNKSDYVKLIAYTFFWGAIIYGTIGLSSLSIVNRTPFKKNPETIEDYFEQGGWQIAIIQILYAVNLFSTYPNFLIISKVRFYELIQTELKKSLTWHQIVYIFVVIIVSFLIFELDIHLDTMIQIAGAVTAFMTSFLIPTVIHLRCVYFERSSGSIEGDHEGNREIKMNECECEIHYSSKWTLYLETFVLIFICIAGLFLMGHVLASSIAP